MFVNWKPFTPLNIWTWSAPAIPNIYWDVYSSEERIKKILLELGKIQAYLDYVAENSDANDKAIFEELEAFKKDLEEYKKTLFDALKETTAKLGENAADWNITQGEHTSTIDAHRQQYYITSVFADAIETFNNQNLTCSSLANGKLNVAGVTMFSNYFKNSHAYTFTENGKGVFIKETYRNA